MPDNNSPIKNTNNTQESENDIFRVVLRVPDREALGQLLQNGAFDFGSIQSQPTGEVIVDIFLNRSQIEQLEKAGHKLEVFENVIAIGKERQKEVGAGDRFEGGKIAPKGLGKKTERQV
jgi:hypothetical protein